MSTCAFDIGIKNLAFCIMSASNQIEAWENVNIVAADEAEAATTCSQCAVKAKWTAAGRPSCRRHLGTMLPLSDTAGKVCTKIPAVKELKAILGSKKAKRDDLVAEAALRFAIPIEAKRKKSVLHESLSVLHDGIRRLIDGRFETFRNCRTFLLENQPVLKNPTMKSVQILLFATIRDCFLSRSLEAPAMRLVHAGRKTAGFIDDEGGDAGYATRKAGGEARAIDFCRRSAPDWLPIIEGAKKKSDLADALCMTLDARVCATT